MGRSRTPIGEVLERLSALVGSVEAVAELLATAGVDARVSTAEVTVPWPGVDAYLDYRLAMPSTARPTDVSAL